MSRLLRPGAKPNIRVGPGERREHLRRATDGVHRVLEATLEDTGCFASAGGYRRYLGAIAPIYAGLEAALDAAGVLRLVPDWPRRRKLGLILADLHEAGGEVRCHIADRPAPAITAEPWCVGDVFGALYVLEGATLGGAVLARRMRHPGPACAPLGITLDFLDPYGDERGMLWRTFLDRLETVELTQPEEEALCPRAAATFGLFVTATNGFRCERALS